LTRPWRPTAGIDKQKQHRLYVCGHRTAVDQPGSSLCTPLLPPSARSRIPILHNRSLTSSTHITTPHSQHPFSSHHPFSSIFSSPASCLPIYGSTHRQKRVREKQCVTPTAIHCHQQQQHGIVIVKGAVVGVLIRITSAQHMMSMEQGTGERSEQKQVTDWWQVLLPRLLLPYISPRRQ